MRYAALAALFGVAAAAAAAAACPAAGGTSHWRLPARFPAADSSVMWWQPPSTSTPPSSPPTKTLASTPAARQACMAAACAIGGAAAARAESRPWPLLCGRADPCSSTLTEHCAPNTCRLRTCGSWPRQAVPQCSCPLRSTTPAAAAAAQQPMRPWWWGLAMRWTQRRMRRGSLWST